MLWFKWRAASDTYNTGKQWHHADDVTNNSVTDSPTSPVNQFLINRWSVARTLRRRWWRCVIMFLSSCSDVRAPSCFLRVRLTFNATEASMCLNRPDYDLRTVTFTQGTFKVTYLKTNRTSTVGSLVCSWERTRNKRESDLQTQCVFVTSPSD